MSALQIKHLRSLLGLGLVASLAACQNSGDGGTVIGDGGSSGGIGAPTPVEVKPLPQSEGPQCFREMYIQGSTQATDKVDILFVIDTSASLYNKLDRIADNLDRFIAALPKDTDARFAIVVAHSQGSEQYGKLFKRKETGSNLCRVYDSGSKVRQFCDALPTADKKDYAVIGESLGMTRQQVRERFRMKITKLPIDWSSDGGELGLIAARRALHVDNINGGKKLGFFREDAGLATVFVADENDLCAIYPEGVKPVADVDGTLEKKARDLYCKQWWNVEHPQSKIDFYKKHFSISFPAHYAFLEDIVQRAIDAKGSQPFGFAGIIYTDPNTVPKKSGIEDEIGYGYKEFVEGTKGTLLDLGRENFFNDLAFLGEQVGRTITVKKDFVLQNADVDPKTIEVRIGAGRVVAHVFDAATNTVHIEDPGNPNDEVFINYCKRGPVVDPSPTPEPSVSPTPTPPAPTPTPSSGGGTDPEPTPTPSPSPTFPGGCNALDCDGTGI